MRLNPDDPASDEGRRGRLIVKGLLPNPDGYCAMMAMPQTAPHPLLGIFSNLILELGDDLNRANQELEAAFAQVRKFDRHLCRVQDALTWLASEYELDDVARDVIDFARSGQDI